MPPDPHCQRCSLKDFTHVIQHVCVWGDYRQASPVKKCRVLVLGEAPGYHEDAAGRVFTGESGRLLREAFEAIGFDEPYYITNTAKCFPPMKLPRDAPKGCADYLEEEIAEVQPEFILALGNTAIQRLIGRGKITEIAGKEIWSEKYHCWIVPALHPAAILRNMGRHSGWLADLRHFKALIDGELPSEIPVKSYDVDNLTKLEKLAEILSKSDRWAFDFEATPIPWWHVDWKPYCVSFSVNGAQSFVIPLEHPLWQNEHGGALTWMDEVRAWALRHRELFQDPKILKNAHNRLYDSLAWRRTFGWPIKTTHCSMIAVQVLNENEPKALKWQCRTRLGWPDWDIDARLLHPWPKTRDYNGTDAAGAWRLLYEHYLPELAEQGLAQYYTDLCMKDADWVERMLWTGMPVDQVVLTERAAIAARELESAKEALPVANPNSSQQVGKWLFEELGLPVLALTPAGAPSTSKDTINRLALMGHEEPKGVLKVRSRTKEITTYYEPIDQMVEQAFDHRLHPDIRMASVETGRHSSFMHTLPRDATVRSIVRTTDPGWELIELDFAQLEARLCAWAAAGKPRDWSEIDWSRATMLRFFREGTDVYKWMAGNALGKPPEAITPKERQELGKVPVLAMLYKISWKGLREYAWHAMQLDWNEGFARHLWHTFNTLFPEFPRWHQDEAEKIISRGWVRTEIGRIRRLPDAQGYDKKQVEEAIRSGINMPIQGLGSDITQMAGILIDYKVDRDLAHIVHEIHDALILETRRAEVVRLTPVLKYYMEHAHQALRRLGLYLPDGLLICEEKIGPWGEGVDLKKYQEKLAAQDLPSRALS